MDAEKIERSIEIGSMPKPGGYILSDCYVVKGKTDDEWIAAERTVTL